MAIVVVDCQWRTGRVDRWPFAAAAGSSDCHSAANVFRLHCWAVSIRQLLLLRAFYAGCCSWLAAAVRSVSSGRACGYCATGWSVIARTARTTDWLSVGGTMLTPPPRSSRQPASLPFLASSCRRPTSCCQFVYVLRHSSYCCCCCCCWDISHASLVPLFTIITMLCLSLMSPPTGVADATTPVAHTSGNRQFEAIQYTRSKIYSAKWQHNYAVTIQSDMGKRQSTRVGSLVLNAGSCRSAGERSWKTVSLSGVLGWKTRRGGKLQFSDRGDHRWSKLQFCFLPKFPQNGGFSASNFAFLDENFSTRSFDNFPTVENLGKWQVLICSKF